MSLERLSEPLITDLPRTEPVTYYDTRLGNTFEKFLGVYTESAVDTMRAAGMSEEEIINTNIIVSADTHSNDNGILTFGTCYGETITTFVGSVMQYAEQLHARGLAPKNERLGATICRLVSGNIVHEIQHRADRLRMGGQAIESEQKSYEKFYISLSSVPEAVSMLGAIGAIGAAEYAAITYDKYPVLAGVAGALILAGSAKVVHNRWAAKVDKIKQSFDFYLLSPMETRARQFEQIHGIELQQGEPLLFWATLPGEYDELFKRLSPLDRLIMTYADAI